jgi:NADH-quinone oxidoreductase subunit A
MAHRVSPRTAFRGRSLYWNSSERNARRCLCGRGSAGQVVERGYVLGTFGPIALFLVVAVVFPVVPLILSRFLAPNKPNPVKLEPYESGMETIGPTHVQFPIRYYLYALIFVIFDVEVIYLFPWALVYDKLPVIAAAEMAVFIVLLLVGLAYAWRKRAFEWQ